MQSYGSRYVKPPIVFGDADLGDGLPVGDLVRMEFSGGIGALENPIAGQPVSDQLRSLAR